MTTGAPKIAQSYVAYSSKEARPARQCQNLNMTTMTDEWLSKLSKLAPEVDNLYQRVQEFPAVSESSSFAEDNRRHPKLVLKSTFWHSLAVSIEHEHMFLECFRATKTTFPSSYLTVLRTALMSASRAVWVLSPPNRMKRFERAFMVRLDDLQSQIKAINSWTTVPNTALDSAKSVELQRLRGDLAGLAQVAADLSFNQELSRFSLNQTRIIQWVAGEMYLNEPEKVNAIDSLWRTGSAAAHGQRHFGAQRYEMSSDGSTILAGSLEDIGPAAVTAVAISTRAWDTFAQRII